MNIVSLIGYQVNEYVFKNRMPSGSKISLGTKYSYNVKFAKENRCKGELVCEVCDRENPDSFALKLVMCAFFTYKEDAEKARVHVASFQALFPYARSYVSMVSAAAGITPIMLPEANIESQNIYSFEKPEPRDNNNK